MRLLANEAAAEVGHRFIVREEGHRVIVRVAHLEVCFAVQLRSLDVAHAALVGVLMPSRQEHDVRRELITTHHLHTHTHARARGTVYEAQVQ